MHVNLSWPIAAGVIFSSAAALLTPWCIVQAIDSGIASGNMAHLWFWIALAALAQIVSGAVRYAVRCHAAHAAYTEYKKCFHSLYCRVFEAELQELPDADMGALMSRIASSSTNVRAFTEAVYNQFLPIIITGIGTAVALLSLSPLLAAASFLAVPVVGGLWWWMHRRVRPASRACFVSLERMYAVLAEAMRSMISIRALKQTHHFEQKMSDSVGQYAENSLSLIRRQAVQTPFFDCIQAAMLVAVFGIGGWCVMQGSQSLGVIVGFQVYMVRFFGVMRSGTGFLGTWQHYTEGRARAQAIEQMRTAPKAEYLKSESPEVLCLSHFSISFGTRCIWNDLNLTLRAGEKHAILLPSGGGKTTLARAILGLYPHHGGTIAIPDGDTARIGFVPQENVLFNASVRENICLLNEALGDEGYAQIAEICGLKEVCARMGETPIGEQGGRLSGGEQRRVMLARALARKPALLIIDQMASELEPELCRYIFAQISHAFPEMAVLYFGHRMPEWDGDIE